MMTFWHKVEQALLAVDNERKAVDAHRRGGTIGRGISQQFHHPEDTARALVRALEHEGLMLIARERHDATVDL